MKQQLLILTTAEEKADRLNPFLGYLARFFERLIFAYEEDAAKISLAERPDMVLFFFFESSPYQDPEFAQGWKWHTIDLLRWIRKGEQGEWGLHVPVAVIRHEAGHDRWEDQITGELGNFLPPGFILTTSAGGNTAEEILAMLNSILK
ncbi:MAG: hypothetical protein WCX97_00835 [Candidatus Magasanikbacteria bacterium]